MPGDLGKVLGGDSWDLYPGDSTMMAVSAVFSLFCDSWHLYRKYILSKLNEKELDEFIQESGELFQKYKQDPFAKDLLLAVTNEIERKEKNK